jgi:hypothetical protein
MQLDLPIFPALHKVHIIDIKSISQGMSYHPSLHMYVYAAIMKRSSGRFVQNGDK